MKQLELQTKVIDKTVYVRLSGDVESDNAAGLRESLKRDIPAGAKAVYVDLSAIRRVDTAGIAVLVSMANDMRESGGRVYLVQVPSAVSLILELLGSARDAFRIFSTLDEALRLTRNVQLGRLHDPTKPITAK